MAQGDGVAGLAADADAQPADQVLPEVDHDAPLVVPAHADRSELLDPADRRAVRGEEDRGVEAAEDLYRRPGGVVESRCAPTRLFEAGVVRFALVQPGHDDRPGARAPAGSGGDGLGGAVGVGDVEFREQAGARAVQVAGAAVEAEQSPVPAVGQVGAPGIGARPQQTGDVERLVAVPVVIARPARGEHDVADDRAVQLRLVHAQGSDQHAGAVHRPAHGETGTQQHAGSCRVGGGAGRGNRWGGNDLCGPLVLGHFVLLAKRGGCRCGARVGRGRLSE